MLSNGRATPLFYAVTEVFRPDSGAKTALPKFSAETSAGACVSPVRHAGETGNDGKADKHQLDVVEVQRDRTPLASR